MRIIKILSVVALGLFSAAQAYALAPAEEGRIYTIADTLDRNAEFPGGLDRLIDYINENIKDPHANGYDQPVYCTFLVMPYGEIDYGSINFLRHNADGSWSDARPLTAYENGVREVIRKIPGFIAAEQDGDRVTFQYVLPINCKMEEIVTIEAPEPAAVATATAKERAEYTAGTRTAPKRTDGVYTMWDKVDSRPEYPEGSKALYKALNANLKRPHFYSHQKMIFCSFIILENGEIDDNSIKCVHKKGVGTYVDAPQYTTWEKCVMESVKLLPDFVPAKKDGKGVKYEYILPVSFK